MIVNNSVIFSGDPEQIELIKTHFFQEEDITFTKTGLVFSTHSQIPAYQLQEISRDYPDVKISYYYYTDNPNGIFVIGYKKLVAGDIIDTLVWSNANKTTEREEKFAKRFFARCLPMRYEEIFCST